MKTVVINTKAWTRGICCDRNGKCCAVGFICKSELKREGIKNPTPEEINTKASDFLMISGNITSINDDQYGLERRKNLREALKELGYRAVFK